MTDGSCRRFENQVAVVTGAAQGIGFAIAKRLGGEGAQVVVADRVEQAGTLAVKELKAIGIDATFSCVDLSKYCDARRLMSEAETQYGGIDVLVNNVGGTILKKPFWHYEEEEILAEVERSFWPTLWCCRAVLEYLRRRGGGSIVNIGSNATHGIYRIPYSASKGGVVGLTTALAVELAEMNVRVNCVSPGATAVTDRRTQRLHRALSEQETRWNEEFYTYVRQENLFGRFASVDEQASVVAFLASKDAAYITGEVIDTGKRGMRVSTLGQGMGNESG